MDGGKYNQTLELDDEGAVSKNDTHKQKLFGSSLSSQMNIQPQGGDSGQEFLPFNKDSNENSFPDFSDIDANASKESLSGAIGKISANKSKDLDSESFPNPA